MITRVFKSLTCMLLILFKHSYKIDPETSVTLNYFSHQVPRSTTTESWQYEAIIDTWAPHLRCRAGKTPCSQANHLPAQRKWRKEHRPDSLISEKNIFLIYQSNLIQSYEPETRQTTKNTDTTVFHSPHSFQCFRKGYHKTNKLLSTRICIFPKSHRWPDKRLKLKFSSSLPLISLCFLFGEGRWGSFCVELESLSDFIKKISLRIHITRFWEPQPLI